MPARRGASVMQLQFLHDAGNMDTKMRIGREGRGFGEEKETKESGKGGRGRRNGGSEGWIIARIELFHVQKTNPSWRVIGWWRRWWTRVFSTSPISSSENAFIVERTVLSKCNCKVGHVQRSSAIAVTIISQICHISNRSATLDDSPGLRVKPTRVESRVISRRVDSMNFPRSSRH